MNWAAEYGKTAEQPTPAPVPETPADTPKTSVKTGDSEPWIIRNNYISRTLWNCIIKKEI